ncbi:MAG TPA: ribbon-helix-helix domain-containing protein [Candidatus Margulisiibacteriota bacterium]|nr:ribbon-helix-helix domain-containing protein [Candidatus Margulisiibacteriota bacterium]
MDVAIANHPFSHIVANMKTIAISIDEPTLKLLDEVAAPGRRSRSAAVRAAIRAFAEQRQQHEVETREREILRRNRRRLARQARALVTEQARP